MNIGCLFNKKIFLEWVDIDLSLKGEDQKKVKYCPQKFEKDACT